MRITVCQSTKWQEDDSGGHKYTVHIRSLRISDDDPVIELPSFL